MTRETGHQKPVQTACLHNWQATGSDDVGSEELDDGERVVWFIVYVTTYRCRKCGTVRRVQGSRVD